MPTALTCFNPRRALATVALAFACGSPAWAAAAADATGQALAVAPPDKRGVTLYVDRQTVAGGITRIAEALALPFIASFGAVRCIGSALTRRRRAVSSGMLWTRRDRDSLGAGDDTDPHAQLLEADPRTTAARLLGRMGRMNDLASLAGGRATGLAEGMANEGTR